LPETHDSQAGCDSILKHFHSITLVINPTTCL
jgi:hypothetical protein